MRSPHYVSCLPLLIVFLVTALTRGQQAPRTEAQIDGLAGPVQSVSTAVARSVVRWQQPAGPTLVMPIWCMDCAYDRDGYKTKSGQVLNGAFTGEVTRIVRDGNGRVSERFVAGSDGQIGRHDVVGPFGATETTFYVDGKTNWRQTHRYDEYGNMTEWLTFDSTGKQISAVQERSEPDGTLKEKSAWGADGHLSYQQTFNPDTQVEHFSTFDASGKMDLTWTVVDGKLTSFWQLPGSLSQFGRNFTEHPPNGDEENYSCQADGKCNVSHVHYEYLDAKKRNPKSAEWRDASGNLEYAAYYDYEIDSFRNWTSRRVWVWSRDLGERKLYETDSRTITYWQE